jgi:drug/metabolite transporter (DMT)-like permease
MTAQTARSATLAGIALMLIAVFLFSITDVVGKWLVATYSVGQLLLIRSLTMLLLLAPFIHRGGLAALAAAPRPGLQLLRVLCSTLDVVMFFWAVSYLPLVDATVFYMAGVIYVTVLSALLLKERVDRRRWIAVLAGFAGVVIALRPTPATFTLPALIALAGSACFALMIVLTRVLRDTDETVLLTTQLFGSFAFGAFAAPFVWVTPSLFDLTFLSGFGVISPIALFCTNRSLRLAPASVVVPYQYTFLVWAALFGWLVFGDIPDRPMLLGGVMIVAAGLYILRREHTAARGDPPFAPLP